jgi:hypothetical protein
MGYDSVYTCTIFPLVILLLVTCLLLICLGIHIFIFLLHLIFREDVPFFLIKHAFATIKRYSKEEPRSLQKTRLLRQGAIKQTTMIVYTTYFILKDIEEGHLMIENFVNIFFVTSVSVSLHNLLDFYNLFCLCCIVMSRRSVTH